MSDYFRDVTIEPPEDGGNVTVSWLMPDGDHDGVNLFASEYGGADGALAAATELHDRLTSPLLAPLPEGVEWVRRAPASVVRELGWHYLNASEWVREVPPYLADDFPLICRPQPPQVTVGDTTLPADASVEDIVAAFRAAGGAS